MKIKVGGVYKTRNGERVEIVEYDDGDFKGSDGYYRYPDGCVCDRRGNCSRDLIAEWHDEPAAKVGEWIGWNGGECPVHPNTVVDGIESNGCVWNNCAAKYCDWPSFRGAYRVIKPYVEPKKAREWWMHERDGKLLLCCEECKDAIHVREVLDDE